MSPTARSPENAVCAHVRAACGLAAVLMGATLALSASRPLAEVTAVGHRKLRDCVQVKAGKTTLVVVPAWAGRISVLDFGAGNVVWTDPRIDGWVLDAKDAWSRWDGDATDVVRDDGKNQWKGLWLHPWPLVKKLQDGVEVASEVGKEANLSARRSYRLSDDGRKLTYAYTITCHGGEPNAWTIWERALVPAEGYAIAPVAKGGEFPNGWIVRDKAATVDPADRALNDGDFLVLKAGTIKGVGLAAKLRAGWIGVVRGDNALLVTFPIAKDGRYPHHNGANAAFFLNPDNLELEPLSPEVTLKEGESATFTQVWHWVDLPSTLKKDSPAAMGKWLEETSASLTK